MERRVPCCSVPAPGGRGDPPPSGGGGGGTSQQQQQQPAAATSGGSAMVGVVDKTLGMTSAISTAPPKASDLQRTQELEETLRQFGLFESEEELAHRCVCPSSSCTAVSGDRFGAKLSKALQPCLEGAAAFWHRAAGYLAPTTLASLHLCLSPCMEVKLARTTPEGSA